MSGECRDADPDLFFPPAKGWASEAHTAVARAICAQCLAQPRCRDFAITTRQEYGIWGGTTPDERWRLASTDIG